MALVLRLVPFVGVAGALERSSALTVGAAARRTTRPASHSTYSRPTARGTTQQYRNARKGVPTGRNRGGMTPRQGSQCCSHPISVLGGTV